MWVRSDSRPRLTAALTFIVLAQPYLARTISKTALLQTGQFVRRDDYTQAPTPPRSYRLEVIRTFPHEGLPFTQGLEIHSDGHHLVETSGSYPTGTESYIRILDPATGKTVRSLKDGLEGRFIEGIVQTENGHWFASTYTDKTAVEYDSNLNKIAEHTYPHMGWGLTRTPNGESFLATNSSEHILTLQKNTFEVLDSKVVTCMGKRVSGLNELEMLDDFMGLGPTILGNVYLSRLVLAVNPATGECIGAFDLNVLGVTETSEAAGFHAANGLAYNKSSGTLYATGKNWDTMYEVRILDDPQGITLPALSRHLMTAPAVQAEGPMLLEVVPGADSFLEAGRNPRTHANAPHN